jgi:CBS domain-containing protein
VKQNEPVYKIMSSDLKTVHIAQKLSEARKVLADGAFEHLPVVSGDKLVGLLSSTDLMRLTYDAGNTDARSIDAVLDNQFTLEGVMTKNIQTIKRTDTVRYAAELLVKGTHHSLPVVEDDGKLIGIVTSTDLIRYLLDQY